MAEITLFTGLNRELSIPTDATFYHLHIAIQDLFNWEGDHLYAFTVGGRNDAINIGANESQHLLPVRLFDILQKDASNPRRASHTDSDLARGALNSL